jgi:hypothetical protein
MKVSKRSKLEIIGKFDLQSMFYAELELYRSKRSDSSGIKNLTSIPFYIYMARKKKHMEIITFKDKSHILLVLTFVHSDLNILSYRSPFDANSIFLNS